MTFTAPAGITVRNTEMESDMKKSTVYALCAVAMWSTLAATTKLLLNGMPNFEVLALCSLIAAVFLFVFTLCRGRLNTFRQYSAGQYLRMAGLSFLGIFAYNALYFYGLSQLSSQTACILNYLWPVMLVVFSCLILKEKLTGWKMLAILCSFIGVVILTADGSSMEGGHTVLGAAACILDAVAYGLFCVLNKNDDIDQGVMMTVAWTVSAVFSTVFGLLTEQWVPVSAAQYPGFLWLGIVPNAAGYLLWALALKSADETSSVSNYAFAVPFLSLFVSALLLHERIRLNAVLALVFIVGGILVRNILGTRGEKT